MIGPIVQARGLVRTYRAAGGQVRALRGVDLDVFPGTLVVLRGRSGSGKTTLLNLLGGLDRPDSGSVVLDGRDLVSLSEAELARLRRHRLAFVFQGFALLPTFSAYENVDLALRLAGASRRERHARTMEVLDLVGLADKARHRPFELSGGEQQRVAIARALANRPALLLADEPTGELDTRTAAAIFALLRRLVREQGVAVVLATHDPAADEVADVRYRIVDGQVLPETWPGETPGNGEG